jgi:hypothetical protein
MMTMTTSRCHCSCHCRCHCHCPCRLTSFAPVAGALFCQRSSDACACVLHLTPASPPYTNNSSDWRLCLFVCMVDDEDDQSLLPFQVFVRDLRGMPFAVDVQSKSETVAALMERYWAKHPDLQPPAQRWVIAGKQMEPEYTVRDMERMIGRELEGCTVHVLGRLVYGQVALLDQTAQRWIFPCFRANGESTVGDMMTFVRETLALPRSTAVMINHASGARGAGGAGGAGGARGAGDTYSHALTPHTRVIPGIMDPSTLCCQVDVRYVRLGETA